MIIEWLPRAVATRNDQLTYIAQESMNAAREVAARIEQQTGQLAQFPELGRTSQRKRGLRELIISRTSLIVFYRVRSKLERVEIVRVAHTSRKDPLQ